jgi:hypothetical protein
MPLPPYGPDSALVESAVSASLEDWRAFQIRLERLEGRRRQAALWLVALEGFAVLELGLAEGVPGLTLLSFAIEFEAANSLQMTAYVHPDAVEDSVERVPEFRVPAEQGDALPVDVQFEPWVLTLHSPVNLRYGTLSCWVRTQCGDAGIVTARHAVDMTGHVYLDDGTAEGVLWYAPNCLDAAVTDAPSGRTLKGLPVTVPMSGDLVDVCTKGGPEVRSITGVGQTYGTVTGAIPHVFLLDRPFYPGDSGSLVRLSGEGDALGIYLGALTTSKGDRGFCQGLTQLDHLFARDNLSIGFYEEI